MPRFAGPSALVLVATALLCAPAAPQEGAEIGGTDMANATATTPAEEYLVGVGDVLHISVWRNEELATTAPVRPDGRVSAILVGDVEVAGRGTDEIRALLTRRYEEYINSPGVSVVVTEIHSRRIYVLGEVEEPGVYDLGQPTRLLQALAMAGGLTEFAKKDEIVLLRDVSGERRRYQLNLKAILSGAQIENDVVLRPGDTIVVP